MSDFVADVVEQYRDDLNAEQDQPSSGLLDLTTSEGSAFEDQSTLLNSGDLNQNDDENSEDQEPWAPCCCGPTRCETCSPRRIGFGRWWYSIRDAPRHFWRSLFSNLGIELHSPQEEGYLRTLGLSGKNAMTYLAWRKSCLMVLMVPLMASVAISFWKQLEDAKWWVQIVQDYPALDLTEMLKIMDYFRYIYFGVLILSLIMTFLALRYWSYYHKSRLFLMLSWNLHFLAPFLFSFYPYYSSAGKVDGSKLNITVPYEIAPGIEIPITMNLDQIIDHLGGGNKDLLHNYSTMSSSALLSFYISAWFFTFLAPAALSLPIAFVRAGLAMRTLVWRSPVPGVFLEVIPLTSIPLIWIAFIVPYQTVGNIFMLLASLSLFASLLVFVFGSRLTRLPMGNHRAHTLSNRMRIIFLSWVLVAAIFFGVYIWRAPFRNFLWEHLATPSNLVEFPVSFLSEYFFTTVFGCDFLLHMILISHQGATRHIFNWKTIPEYPENKSGAYKRHNRDLNFLAEMIEPVVKHRPLNIKKKDLED